MRVRAYKKRNSGNQPLDLNSNVRPLYSPSELTLHRASCYVMTGACSHERWAFLQALNPPPCPPESCPLQIRPPIKLRACHAGYKINKNNGGFASYFFRKKDHGCTATPCIDVLKAISRMARSIIGAFACVSRTCLLDCLRWNGKFNFSPQ